MPDKNFIDKLSTFLGLSKPVYDTQTTIQKQANDTFSISTADFTKLVNKTRMASTGVPSSSTKSNTVGNLASSFLAEKFEDTAASSIDAERISALLPDINDAIAIRAASILSPDNYLTEKVGFELKSDLLEESEINQIIDIVEAFFTNEYNLAKKLSSWLPDIMRISGSKPIMVLPCSVLNKLRNSEVTTALENLSIEEFNIKKYDKAETPTKFRSDKFQKTIEYDKLEQTCLSMATEAFNQSKVINPTKNKNTPDEKKIKDELKKVLDNIKDSISIISDPTILFTSTAKRAMSIESLNDKIQSYFDATPENSKNTFAAQNQRELNYRTADFIDMAGFISNEKPLDGDIPLFLEVSPAATIPLAMPGNPTNHVGYFIVLNEYGESASIVSADQLDLLNQKSQKEDSLVKELYSTMYGTDMVGMNNKYSNTQYAEVFKQVYASYIQNSLASYLNDEGIHSVSFNITQDTLHIMLSSILQKKKTKVLFVPASMMSYFHIKLDSNGIGAPLAKDGMFILSMRVTYLVTKMLAMMNNSINNKQLTVAFDNTISNPIEELAVLKRAMVDKVVRPFAYDPNTIMQNIADQHLSVKMEKAPGLDAFSISNESIQANNNQSDDDLMSRLDDMSVSHFGVPHSLLNKLSEDEFATSVVTQNIMFSLKCSKDRDELIEPGSTLIRNTIKYHASLRKKIEACFISSSKQEKDLGETESISDQGLQENNTISEAKAEKELSESEKEINAKFDIVLNNIKLKLPEGKISHHKAMAEEVKNYKQIVNDIIDALFADDTVSQEDAEKLTRLKGIYKYIMFKDFLDNSLASQEFDLKFLDTNDMDKFNAFTNRNRNIFKYFDAFDKSLSTDESDAESDMGNSDNSSDSNGSGFNF